MRFTSKITVRMIRFKHENSENCHKTDKTTMKIIVIMNMITVRMMEKQYLNGIENQNFSESKLFETFDISNDCKKSQIFDPVLIFGHTTW